ncbi:pyruvate kinase 1, cytosolic-like [Apium graveolens]|uniref:pyruvate kinase 1, cytosolic-like n=1 Tax=Apium graveolens TaxID=4045 RepID=UPI003D78E76D
MKEDATNFVRGIDFIGELPKAKEEVKYTVVAVGYFTKWAKPMPIATIPAKKIKDFVFNSIVCRFGIPYNFVFDNGKQFDSKELQQLCEDLKIKKEFVAVYHPQSNGQTEAVNKIIKYTLKSKLEEYKGNWPKELPKVFLFQKAAVYKCNMAGKPATVTRVVDSMTGNLRSTRAEATDVANVVLYGSDAILLGVETLRGLYPVETISIVGKIYAEAEKVFNQDMYLKKTVKYVGEPMTHLESIASSVVRAAIKVKASVIICLTSSGRGARLIAKYRPTIPNLSVVIPRLKTNQLRWSFSGAFEAESTGATNEYVLKVALDHGKSAGVIKSHNRVVVCQKVGDTSMVKIIELED